MYSNLDNETGYDVHFRVSKFHKFPLIFIFFSISRDKCLEVVLMEQKTLTLLLKENRPTAQRATATFLRGSGWPERPPASARVHKVSTYNRSIEKFDLVLDLRQWCFHFSTDTPDIKRAADHDESPPLTPTGNAPSSESELDISSPNASHDESQAKDQATGDLEKDLSHRPKRRRCHETYNFNMKCPTPGCNSLGMTFK